MAKLPQVMHYSRASRVRPISAQKFVRILNDIRKSHGLRKQQLIAAFSFELEIDYHTLARAAEGVEEAANEIAEQIVEDVAPAVPQVFFLVPDYYDRKLN